MEQVDANPGLARHHARLVDGEPLGQGRSGHAVELERRHVDAPHPLDEELDQLGILAVDGERDPAPTPLLAVGPCDPLHHREEVAEVVGVGHGVGGGVRGGGGQVQPLVEHVVLEAGDPGLGHHPVDLVELRGGHGRDVEAVVTMGPTPGPVQDLRQDLPVRTGLVQIVTAGAEVADDAGGAADQGRLRLRRRVELNRPIDAEVEVAVDAAGEDDPAPCVDRVVRLCAGYLIGDGGDPPIPYPDGDLCRLIQAGQHHPAVADHDVVTAHASSSSDLLPPGPAGSRTAASPVATARAADAETLEHLPSSNQDGRDNGGRPVDSRPGQS